MTPGERKAYNKEYREKNKERLHAYDRARAKKKGQQRKKRLAANPEARERERANARIASKRPHRRAAKHRWTLKATYGLTPKQWHRKLIAQAGLCAICKEPMAKQREPHVDHDHESGKIRDLLCNLCNGMLGKAREKTRILSAGISYLNRHHPERNRT